MKRERAEEEEQAAQDYAWALWHREANIDFANLNSAIIARWSVSALERIKRRAWDIIERGK